MVLVRADEHDVGLDRDVLPELAASVEVGGQDPLLAEAGVDGSALEVADHRQVGDCGAGVAPDDDDLAVPLQRQVLAEVVPEREPTGHVGGDQAETRAVGVVARDVD